MNKLLLILALFSASINAETCIVSWTFDETSLPVENTQFNIYVNDVKVQSSYELSRQAYYDSGMDRCPTSQELYMRTINTAAIKGFRASVKSDQSRLPRPPECVK